MEPIEIIRDCSPHLNAWSTDPLRKPLLVRGARQVGKSFLIRQWAEHTFGAANYLEINFEEQPKYRELFKGSLDPTDLQREINLSTGFKFGEGTLLFLDEVQACPQALLSLRFFFEKMPEQRVIAAGSLLEFILEEISFPVGRVRSMFIAPLSFGEFIQAFKGPQFRTNFEALELSESVPELLHAELNRLLRLYFRLGGMPNVVKTYLATNDISAAAQEQREILQSYLDDLAKYSKKVGWEVLQTVFTRLPSYIMQSKVTLSKIGDGLKADKVRAAIYLFEMAHVLSSIYSSSAQKPPLEALASSDRRKIAFLDLGLLQAALGFDWGKFSLDSSLLDVCDGAFAEQFVAQELTACGEVFVKPRLYYWSRDAHGSEAEVDFLLDSSGKILPVEVKNSPKGRLKSLHLYQQLIGESQAVILCQRNIERLEGYLWAPLYMAGKLQKQHKIF